MFNPASGNTHLLDISSGQVLTSLMSGPAETVQIQDGLASFLDVDNDDRLGAAVSVILGSLQDLGLIEADTQCA